MGRSLTRSAGKIWTPSGQLYNDPRFGDRPGDQPPLVASTWDDEFEDGSIDAKWSWINQGTATIAEKLGHQELFMGGAAGDQWRLRLQAWPNAAFTMSAKIFNAHTNANFSGMGLVLYNSGNGKLIAWGRDQSGGYRSWRFTSVSAFASDYVGATAGPMNTAFYWRIVVSGTAGASTITLLVSHDGVQWLGIANSETIANFLGAITHIGFGLDNNDATFQAFATVNWFRVTTP